MTSSQLKITVVTVNLNHASGLKNTLASVARQDYTFVEHIVIDGGSTDESLVLIKQHTHVLRWVSEPDDGIYPAQNKGWKMATGNYVLFLNSGDRFFNTQTLSLLASGVKNGDEIVYGNKWVERGDGTMWLKEYPSPLPTDFFEFETLPHPTSLIPVKLLHKMGGYDETLKIVSDWKFFRHAALYHKIPMIHVPAAMSIFEAGGLSAKPENIDRINKERLQVKKKEFTIRRRMALRLKSMMTWKP